MKDYKHIEHMRNLNDSLIWERMKRCYDYGYEDGQKEKPQAIYEMKVEEYNKGLNDAWDAAKKIALMDTETSENVTGYFGLFRIMNNLTASEAIAKIKEYEVDHDSEIKVGDEITSYTDITSLVIGIGAWGEWNCITAYGAVFELTKEKQKYWEKTGRHFDAISEVLKQMNREEDK